MDVCLEMVIIHLFFFVAFMIGLGEGQNDSSCGANGPVVRFPFQLNNQPNNSGYPGFLLSCTETNDTVLQLPISVKFFVKDIDYASQVIHLYDPDRCLPRRLQGLDLSSSPFLYNENEDENFSYNYSVLKCSPAREIKYGYMIPCLSGPGYQFYAISSYSRVYEGFLSCTKMYTLRSIPGEILSGVDYQNLELKWSKPQCGLCESKGKRCKWKKNTGSEIECSPANARGIVFYPNLHGFQANIYCFGQA